MQSRKELLAGIFETGPLLVSLKHQLFREPQKWCWEVVLSKVNSSACWTSK